MESPIFNTLYSQVSVMIKDKKITASNVLIITTMVMQAIEKYPSLTGSEKKLICIQIIKKIINDTVEDEDTKDTLLILSDTILPSAIDQIVAASNGAFDLNKINWSAIKNKLCCCCK